MLYIVGADMSVEVMHSDYRLAGSICHCLRRGYSHEKSAHKSRSHGDSDEIYVIHGNVCFLKSSVKHSVDVFQMMSGCDLRYHSSVVFEYIYL